MRAREGTWGVVTVALCVLAVEACDRSAPPNGTGGDDCGPGQLVESDEGSVCVFRRDQPLVIEGGFTCPASFEHRMDTATAIACSARRLDLLPQPVCAQIDGPCDASAPGRSPNGREASAPVLSEASTNELGECIHPCSSVDDCGPIPEFRACENGACVWIGCQTDAQCENRATPGYPQVCRPFSDGTRECADVCQTLADCGPVTPGSRAEAGLIDCVDGGCVPIGCQRDAQCHTPAVCGAQERGASQCMFPCETVADCARSAQIELGLDGPDPNDPFTTEDAFVCRHGLCRGKLGCKQDADCTRWFGDETMTCRTSEALAGG